MYASRRLLTHPLQQLKIRNEAASARLNGPIILNLARHEDVAAIAGGPIERGTPRSYLPIPASTISRRSSRARADKFVIEVARFEQAFEFAWRWTDRNAAPSRSTVIESGGMQSAPRPA